MDEFETFADSAKDHSMLTDDVARADRQQCDFFFASFAEDPFTTVDHRFAKVAAERMCGGLTERQSGAAGCIFLKR